MALFIGLFVDQSVKNIECINAYLILITKLCQLFNRNPDSFVIITKYSFQITFFQSSFHRIFSITIPTYQKINDTLPFIWIQQSCITKLFHQFKMLFHWYSGQFSVRIYFHLTLNFYTNQFFSRTKKIKSIFGRFNNNLFIFSSQS